MSFPRRLATLSLLLIAVSAARTVRASDGRIPISSVPYNITAPGVYYLTQDLTNAAGNALIISAGRVTLDLDGHTLTQSGTSSYAIASTGSFSPVRVTNGTVVGGAYGVILGGATGGDYQIDHMAVTGSGGSGGASIKIFATTTASPAHALIESVRVVTNVGAGISTEFVSGGRISGSSVRSSLLGITLYNSRGMIIEGNTVADSGGAGIQMIGTAGNYSRDNTISNNTIKQNGGVGLFLNAANNCRIANNTVTDNGSIGIELISSNFNSITDNVVAGNSQDGILLSVSASNNIARNSITATTGAPGEGMHLQTGSSTNTIDWNLIAGNAGGGLNMSDLSSTGVIYSNNRFGGNGAGNAFGAGFSAGGNNAGAATNF